MRPGVVSALILIIVVHVVVVCVVHVITVKKNIRISTDILWRVFHIVTEPVSYTLVSVNRRNNEALAHIVPTMV